YTAPLSCTATEDPVPAGYSGDQTDCTTLAPSSANEYTDSCTITNTLNTGTFTVEKDYVGGGPQPDVDVTLTCTGATVVNGDIAKTINEGTPGSWTVNGFSDADQVTCKGTENPIPAGYTADGEPTGTCEALLSTGKCIITNTLNQQDFTFTKE